jgi:dUTP pyrophosphatase
MAFAGRSGAGTLRVKVLNPDMRARYATSIERHNAELKYESGFDVLVSEATEIAPGASALVPLGIAAELVVDGVNYAYDLRPRSSVWKTNIRLANSAGLIDATYRGQLMAAVDNRSNVLPLQLNAGDRFFQLVRCDGAPFSVQLLAEGEELSSTARGAGGFGSTGA